MYVVTRQTPEVNASNQ